jgi:hypothetical protein
MASLTPDGLNRIPLVLGQRVTKTRHVSGGPCRGRHVSGGPGRGRPLAGRVTAVWGTRATEGTVYVGTHDLVTVEVLEQGDSPFYAGLTGLILPVFTLSGLGEGAG